MSEVPLFKNFGKSFSDLLDKKFGFTRELKAKTTTANGVGFEVTGKTSNKAGDYAGALKLTQKNDKLGNLEAELDTDARAKGFIEYNKLQGTLIKVSGDQAFNIGLEVSRRLNSFALTSGLNYSPTKVTFDASGVYGNQGLSAGGAAKFDALSQSVTDYNAGVDYAHKDYNITVKTSDLMNKVNASLHYTVNPDISVGVSFLYNLTSQKDNFYTFGAAFNFDRDTSAKVKLSSTGAVTAYLEQRLANPKVKLGLTSEYTAAKDFNFAPNRFGLSLGFGDV